MAARVLSLNVGRAEATGPRGAETGINKRAVDAVEVRAPGTSGSGVIGDFIGDPKHHGGDDQAVYAVAREELDWWGAELGREIPSGRFGENVTTVDFDVDAALVGERWQIGDVALEVTGPRVPCATFSLAMGVERWVQRFTEHGRTGAYLRVIEPGTIHRGDPIAVIDRPSHDVDVVTMFRAERGDADAIARMVAAGLPSTP